jgi:hypothetical protein
MERSLTWWPTELVFRNTTLRGCSSHHTPCQKIILRVVTHLKFSISQTPLIKVISPPLDKYNRFELAKQRSIFSIISSQIALALKESPNKSPRYFIGDEETLHLKIRAKTSTLLTLPIGTNSNLAKLIFKPKIASKHKNKHRR